MKQKTKFLVYSGLIAALYAAISYLQNVLLPNSASMTIQFRAAEALCVLAFFTPAATPGLSVGCFLFNLSMTTALPLDCVIGSAATFFAAGGMYLLRRYPLPAMVFPALFNSLLVGWELSFYLGGSILLHGSYVALGELAVLYTLGVALYFALDKHRHRLQF